MYRGGAAHAAKATAASVPVPTARNPRRVRLTVERAEFMCA